MGKLYTCVYRCCELFVCGVCLNLLVLILLPVYVENNGAINNIDKQSVNQRCDCKWLACVATVVFFVLSHVGHVVWSH